MRRWIQMAIAISFMATACHAELITIASDNAASYTNGTWSGDEGFGFDPWAFQLTGGGTFLADGNGQVQGIATDNKAWGMWANDGVGVGVQHVAAFRGFAWNGSTWENALTGDGDIFWISLEHGDIETQSSVGFTLRNGNADFSADDYNTGARFEFGWFRGDGDRQPNYTIYDGSGGLDTGIGYTNGFTGLNLQFKMTGTNTYSLVVYDAMAPGEPLKTIDSVLSGSGSIDSVALYNRDTDTSDDAFFNSMMIEQYEAPTLFVVR